VGFSTFNAAVNPSICIYNIMFFNNLRVH
jgi:hypothetical protein